MGSSQVRRKGVRGVLQGVPPQDHAPRLDRQDDAAAEAKAAAEAADKIVEFDGVKYVKAW